MGTIASNHNTQVDCAWCGGIGKWRIAFGNSAPCVVCHGRGAVSVSGYPVKCRHCGGSGRSNQVSPCLTCAGSGWERVVGQ